MHISAFKKKNSASVPILTATNPLNETIITYQKLK
jgi:hypothetical protein